MYQKFEVIFELLCKSRDKKEVDIGDGRLETGYLEGYRKFLFSRTVQRDAFKQSIKNNLLMEVIFWNFLTVIKRL